MLASSKYRKEIAVVITQRLTLDKTQVIRGYPPSDSISVVEFYFDERKTKERANSQAKFLIGNIKQKEPFLQKPVMKK